MAKYKVVGWYSADPTNHLSPPYPVVTFVEATNRAEAFAKGDQALDKEAKHPSELMNWYVREEKI